MVSLAVVEHLEKWEYALMEFRGVGKHVILTTPSAWGELLLRLLLAFRLVHPMTGEYKGYISRKNLESLGYSIRPFLFGLNRLATFINHGGSET